MLEGFHALGGSPAEILILGRVKTTPWSRASAIERRDCDRGAEGAARRIHDEDTALATPVGYTRIIQTNRNPGGTERVPINFEMSPVKIQAGR